MKDKNIIITNSSNGIDYGDLLNYKEGKNLIKTIEEYNLKNLLFFELRDFIIDEKSEGFVKVTFKIPYKILVKKIKKIRCEKKDLCKEK